MPADFALLLPITSRGSGGVGIRSGSDVEVALKEFCEVSCREISMMPFRWKLRAKEQTVQSNNIRSSIIIDFHQTMVRLQRGELLRVHCSRLLRSAS